ncbi:alpha/beta fold hydrolase [Phreatobacter stygius]|uniref:Alpha/beta hydrolase n=1 Tax=Phreatobacter stygius TaxID=1940610 RepID=A0A4D7AZL2_9HYPH|nr:alpha/beta hydrolase [Phreatobacter stygius]QCI64213.1 alpha/beta hydrolase [Phreatobacter stygius]
MAGFTHVDDAGGGRPLVFLHGWSVNSGFFAAQQDLVTRGFRVITPDLPGHGRDRRSDPRLSIEDLSAALAAYLAAARLDDAVLIGWSMGATVAFDHIARRGPAGLAGLVVVDMTAKVANDAGWSLGLSNGQTLADTDAAADRMAANWPRYAPKIAEAMFAAGVDLTGETYRKAALAVAANDGPTMASLWRSLVAADHRATVTGLGIPVLAVAGAESRLYAPEVARWIAASAPCCQAISLAGAGHTPHLEQPQAFNAAIAAFADHL